jgi:hypothetical protein
MNGKATVTKQTDWTSTLLGVAIDVSGSMTSSIRNSQALDLSRLDGVERGFDSLLEDSRRLAREHGADAALPLRVFVYAFGLQWGGGVGDVLRILKASRSADFPKFLEASIERHRQAAMQRGENLRRQASGYSGVASLARQFGFGGVVDSISASAEADARRRLEGEAKTAVAADVAEYVRAHAAEATLSVQELADLWAGGSGKLGDTRSLIFGSTPMRACLEQAEARFARETRPDEQRVLLLISDGDPTDGDPTPIVERLKGAGVSIACAYVTDRDVQKPREMPDAPLPGWPSGARLLFQMASDIDAAGNQLKADGAWRDMLVRSGWTVPAGARLFVQVNNSEALADFMRIAGTALPLRQLIGLGPGR